MNESRSISRTAATPWLAILVASLGYFVDLYDLVIFTVVRVKSLGADLAADGLGLPLTDTTAPAGGWERIRYLFEVLLGHQRGDVTSAGVVILNVQLIGMVIGGFLWGMLGDRKGRLTTLFGSIALYSIANLLNAFVHTVPQYALLRCIAGIGLAGELGAGVTLVSELIDRHRRGWGTMIVAFVGMFGPVAASLVGSWMSWRNAYITGAIMGFSLLALRVGLAESGIFSLSAKRAKRRGDPRMLLWPRERLMRFVCVVGLGTPIWFVGGVVFVFGPELAKSLGCPDVVKPSNIVLCGYLGAAIGDLSSSAASQLWRSRRRAIAMAIVFLIISLTGLFTLGARGATWFYACTFAAGLATGYWAVFVTVAGESFGTNLRATAATVAPNLVRGSAVIIVTAWEFLKPTLGAVGSAAWVGGVVMVIGLLCTWRLPEPYGRDLDWEEN